MLWGYLVKVEERRFTVLEISPTGQRESEQTYGFSEVSYFDYDPLYADGLMRLAKFVPTFPDIVKFVRNRTAIKEMLEEAFQTGEVVRVRIKPEDNSLSVQISGLDRYWVELRDFNDLMEPRSVMIYRRSMISAVRWKTASEEADTFLLNQREG